MCIPMSIPHSPTPDWALERIKVFINNNDEPEVLEAILELIAAVCASEAQDKFKYEAAWAAIDYGYCRTDDCKQQARKHYAAA